MSTEKSILSVCAHLCKLHTEARVVMSQNHAHRFTYIYMEAEVETRQDPSLNKILIFSSLLSGFRSSIAVTWDKKQWVKATNPHTFRTNPHVIHCLYQTSKEGQSSKSWMTPNEQGFQLMTRMFGKSHHQIQRIHLYFAVEALSSMVGQLRHYLAFWGLSTWTLGSINRRHRGRNGKGMSKQTQWGIENGTERE